MKSIYKKGALLAAAALLTFSFSGCGGDKNVSKGSKETLTVGITNFADSLEPTDNYFGWQVMRYAIGECLVHFDNKMNPEPWIAGKCPMINFHGHLRLKTLSFPMAIK